MVRNEICTDFYQIISGSSNKSSTAYMEAVKNTNDDGNAINYLKKFIISIESIASKNNAIDKRITDSKGNINEFAEHDSIEKGLKFLITNKTPVGNAITTDLKSLNSSIEKYKPFYVNGYNKNNRLLILEYECAMYLLITGLAMAISYCFDVTESYSTPKVVPKSKVYFGVTGTKLHEMAVELNKKDHAVYLDQLDKVSSSSPTNVNEYVYTEGIVNTAFEIMSLIKSVLGAGRSIVKLGVNAGRSIKRTMFGIIPLIRSVIYLSYKRKADTILSLEQNMMFIDRNIEILSNKSNIDPNKKEIIIKKQRAKIESYRKKAEKLRAQLEEGEKDAANAIKADDTRMKDTSSDNNQDDDFVLESLLYEKTDDTKEKEMPEAIKKAFNKYEKAEEKYNIKVPTSVKLGFALPNASIYYKYEGKKSIADILFPNNIIEITDGIIEDINSRSDEDAKKLLPLIAISGIGNGDYDVICSDGKMWYYSHDTKNVLQKPYKHDDPEDFYMVDSTKVKYDKDKNKSIYIGESTMLEFIYNYRG